jgi:hypothetical protein
MPLLLDEPVNVPAAPAKTFSILWIRSLQITAPDPNGEGSLYLETLPMSTSKELFWGNGPSELRVNELYRAMQEVPELASAFAAILQAVGPVKAWITEQERLKQG